LQETASRHFIAVVTESSAEPPSEPQETQLPTRPPAPARTAWITGALIVLSIIGSALWMLYPEPVESWMYAPGMELWQGRKWWCLLTSLFLHVDLMHLVFNCYWIWRFGAVLERELPTRGYGALIVMATWISSLAELAVTGSTGVGMSGLVYGLFGYLLIQRMRLPGFARVVEPGTILMLGWLVLCFVMTSAGKMQVANYAHLGGLVAGVLAGGAVGARKSSRLAAAAALLLLLASIVTLFWAPWQDDWRLARAMRSLEKNDLAAALPDLEYVLQHHPEHGWTASTAAQILIDQKEYAKALDLLTRTLELTNDVLVSNTLAWQLATCPDAKIRDGTRAIRVAKQACEATDWSDPSILDTLAAAYAESGDFESAIQWSEKSLLQSNDADAEELRDHLRSFQARQPVREP